MLKEVVLAVVQALTEFLPLSSSGHLALFSSFFDGIDLFYFTTLHLASLIALVYFTRNEIKYLFKFSHEARKMWLLLIIGTVPAATFGFFFHNVIELAFSSPLLLGIGFIFTGNMLILCYNFKFTEDEPSVKSALVIGASQVLALFPGISRSGTTLSFGLFTGLSREEAFKFSFLLAIPLILGAVVLEFGNATFSWSILIGFIICTILSFFALKLLQLIVEKKFLWIFGVYCLSLGIIILLRTF